jgi:uncharacterized coiled-coil DUF342 family protein
MKNFDGLDPQTVGVASNVEAKIVLGNLKSKVRKIEKFLSEEEPHIQELIKSVASIQRFSNEYNLINKRIDELMEESEKLIESIEAYEPEIIIRRKELKDEINDLLDEQDKLKSFMVEVEEAKILVHSAPPEDLAKAEEILDRLFGKPLDVYPKPSGLN